MYYPQQPGSQQNQPPTPMQQMQGNRMARPNLGPAGPHQISSNVAPSPAQQQQIPQMGGVYPHPNSAGSIPFSPQQHAGMGQQQHLYSQQMMTPIMQQPHSQQQLSNPMSVSEAPATPATPQQQLQQPHSIGPPTHLHHQQHVLQQPASIAMSSSMATPAAPASVAAPNSAGSGMGRQAAAQQQMPQTSAPIPPAELDPIGAARMLILRDLRKAIMELNQCAEKTVERLAAELTQQSGSTGEKHEDKKAATGGPLSNLGAGGPHSIGPQSNLGFGGPHSVNPHSVQNPLSVNPQSVSALPPGSVKSASAADESASKKDSLELSPKEQYEMARNNFMNVCDNIERNMFLILEVNRQQSRLYNAQTSSAVAWSQTPAEINAPTSTLPHLLQGFTELMNADKQAIKSNIDSLKALMEKVNGKKTE